jgi:starch phosphorylase
MARLFERHLQKDWRAQHDVPEFWDAIVSIPDEELWAVREALRSYLIAFIRERTRELWTAQHVTAARVVASGTLLDPAALTIGFARRFTDYKRPELIFSNPENWRTS